MIAIDLVSINKRSGTFTYIKSLIEDIGRTKSENQIIIYLCEDLYNCVKKNFFKKNIIFKIKSNYYSNIFLRIFWVQIFLPIELKIQKAKTLFSPMNFCPIIAKLFKIKIILVLHSNLPWTHFRLMPGTYLKKYLIKIFMELSIFFCDHLIVTSKFSEKQIKKIFTFPKKKISIIYLNLNKIFFNKKLNKSYKNINYRSIYLLSIMSCARYHNIINILKAIKNIKKRIDLKYYLVMTILDREYYEEILDYIKNNQLENIIKLFSNLNQKDIYNLYKNANGYIFSSYSEVFGFTTLEAMSLRIPVAVSNHSALPEINAKAAIYFDPNNVKQIEDCVLNILLNNKLRKKLILLGLQNIKRFKNNVLLPSIVLNNK